MKAVHVASLLLFGTLLVLMEWTMQWQAALRIKINIMHFALNCTFNILLQCHDHTVQSCLN